jgi:hypothetical protein
MKMKKWLFIVMAMMIAQSVLWPWMAYTSAVTITHDTSDLIHYWLDDGEDFYAWTITINDGSDTIVMMDRNLWATTYGTNNYYDWEYVDVDVENYGEDWYLTNDIQPFYWYYFQWWNNYWIAADNLNSIDYDDDDISISNYQPSTYSSSTFVRNYIGNKGNLWWWWYDSWINYTPTSYPITNAYDRQWPCPDGYHIPSAGEYALLESILNWNDSARADILLPTAWYVRISDYMEFGSPTYINHDTAYWTSTPQDSVHRWRYEIDEWIGLIATDLWDLDEFNWYWAYRAYPIRCFKNSLMVTFVQNGNQLSKTTASCTPTWSSCVATCPEIISSWTAIWFSYSSSNHTAQVCQWWTITISPDNNGDGYYAQSQRTLTATFMANWNNLNGSSQDIELSCTAYNGEDSCIITTPEISNNSAPTVLGYSTNSENSTSGMAWSNTWLRISWWEIYYAQTVWPMAQIHVTVEWGLVTIGTNTGTAWTLNKNLGELNISNSVQTITGDFWANAFWIEDMKWIESGYYTTLSVSDMIWESNSWHIIPKANIQLKPSGVTKISWADVLESKVVLWDSWNDWTNYTWTWNQTTVTYFNRQNTATSDAGRIGRWWDNLQIKVNVPAHTVADTYRGTLTYTLYEL